MRSTSSRKTVEENDGVVLVPVGPLTNIGLLLARYPGHRGAHRPHRPHGRRDRRGERHAGRGVQHLGGPGGRAPRLHERHRRDDGRARRHAQGPARPAEGGRAARSRAAWEDSSRPSTTSTTAITSGCTAGRARPSTTRSQSRMWSATGSFRPSTATWRSTSARSRAAAAPTWISGSGAARSRTASVGVDVDGPGFIDVLVDRLKSLK